MQIKNFVVESFLTLLIKTVRGPANVDSKKFQTGSAYFIDVASNSEYIRSLGIVWGMEIYWLFSLFLWSKSGRNERQLPWQKPNIPTDGSLLFKRRQYEKRINLLGGIGPGPQPSKMWLYLLHLFA